MRPSIKRRTDDAGQPHKTKELEMKIKAAVLEEMGVERPYAGTLPLKVQEVDLEGPGPGRGAGEDGGRRPLPFGPVGDRRQSATAAADGAGA
jgi:hypothetical protein